MKDKISFCVKKLNDANGLVTNTCPVCDRWPGSQRRRDGSPCTLHCGGCRKHCHLCGSQHCGFQQVQRRCSAGHRHSGSKVEGHCGYFSNDLPLRRIHTHGKKLKTYLRGLLRIPFQIVNNCDFKQNEKNKDKNGFMN